MVTTSSSSKFELIKKLGADHVINYKDDSNWGLTARNLTPGNAGFDHIVEIGGTETMGQSLKAIKLEGIITVIGLVSGFEVRENIMEVLRRVCTLRGIHVGSRQHMEEMMAAIEANNLNPVVDKSTFALEELKEALKYLVC